MKLIVNADDLDYSPHRDRGIFRQHFWSIAYKIFTISCTKVRETLGGSKKLVFRH